MGDEDESFISDTSEENLLERASALKKTQHPNSFLGLYFILFSSALLNLFLIIQSKPIHIDHCSNAVDSSPSAELTSSKALSEPTLKPITPPPAFTKVSDQTLWDPSWVRRRPRSEIKDIHFIFGLWDSMDLPQDRQERVDKWKEINPSVQTTIWTRDLLDTLVSEHFQDWYDIWENLAPIMKSDLGRYFILKQFGGLFADFDVEPFDLNPCLELTSKPVILWIEGNKISNGKSILSFKNTNDEIRKLRQGFGEYDIRVSNYLIAAHEPDSVFINRVLRYSWFRMQKFGATPFDETCKVEPYRVLFLTGPDLVVESTFGIRFPEEYLNEHPEDAIPAPGVEIVHHNGACDTKHIGKGKAWNKSKPALGECHQ